MNCRHSQADLFLKVLNIHIGVLPKVKETNIQDCFTGFQSQNEAVYIHLSQAILRTCFANFYVILYENHFVEKLTVKLRFHNISFVS